MIDWEPKKKTQKLFHETYSTLIYKAVIFRINWEKAAASSHMPQEQVGETGTHLSSTKQLCFSYSAHHFEKIQQFLSFNYCVLDL